MQKIKILIALVATLFCASVQALSLGDAKMLSYLGQPLKLEIPLPSVNAAEGSTIRARIGSPADFERLALEYEHDIATLKVTTRQRGSSWFIEVTSREPFKQPILQFPLRVRSDKGSIIRAYTLLVDPPNYALPEVATTTTKAPRSTPPVGRQPSSENIGLSPYSYRVERGDTLWPIASRFKPRGSNTARMMDAILAANPDAFINNDINRLRAGALLRIPEVAWGQVRIPTASEAEPTVQPEVTRPSQTTTRPQPAAEATDSAPGAAESAQADAVVEVIGKEPTDPTSNQDLQQQIYLTSEEVEKNRIEQEQMRAQIDELRQELTQLQKLMKLKDQQVETLQAVVTTQREALQQPQQQAPAAAANSSQTPKNQPGAPAEQQAAAPTPVATIKVEQPMPQPAATPAAHLQNYYWWILAALVVIVVLIFWLLPKRQRDGEVPLSDLPEISNAPPAPYAKAVSDHHVEQPGSESPLDSGQAKPAPAVPSIEPISHADRAVQKEAGLDIDDLTLDDSLNELTDAFSELEEEHERRHKADLNLPDLPDDDPISEDELAELAQQLNQDLDIETNTALDQESSFSDDELNQLLNDDLDSVLAASEADGEVGNAEIDDSLDMARAYLAVGDKESARELLQQALQKADNAQDRARVEETLAELD